MNKTSSVRIDTDRSTYELLRTGQNRSLVRIGLLLLGAFLLILLVVFLADGHSGILVVAAMVAVLAIIAAPLALLFYAGRRRQSRLYDQYFLCGPQKLIHVVRGKPQRAIPYTDIWLGNESLVLGKERLALYRGHGKHRSPLWSHADVQREIGARIPPEQNMATDIDLGRALMKQSPWLGLRILAARYAVALTVVLVLLLKAWNVIQHFWGVKLWQVMH